MNDYTVTYRVKTLKAKQTMKVQSRSKLGATIKAKSAVPGMSIVKVEYNGKAKGDSLQL